MGTNTQTLGIILHNVQVLDLMTIEKHPSINKLREIVMEVLVERWWEWCLMHPDLTGTKVHETRRVCLHDYVGSVCFFV